MGSTGTLSFLRKILPATGRYCAGTLFKSGAFTNEPCDTLEALAAAVHRADSAGHDAYMALASFGPGGNQSQDSRNWKDLRTRTNVVSLRSLWIDIDIGATKAVKGAGYATRADAGAALGDFLIQSGLPQPMIVSSGGGFHCYWPLSSAVHADVWYRAANALKSLCLGLGLRVDPTCTTDAARVLRPVDTHNRKSGDARLVRVVSDNAIYSDDDFIGRLVAASAPFRQLLGTTSASKPTAAIEPMFADAPQYVRDTPQVSALMRDLPRAVPIVRGCQQVREAGTQAEPVWHRMISVVRLCTNGTRMIHGLSALDEARYDPTTTQRKIDHVAASQGTNGMPATCVSFNNERPGVCTDCPHWTRIKSPITLGMAPAPQQIVIGNTPPVPLPAAPATDILAELPWVIPTAPAPLTDTVIEFNTYQFRLTPQGILHLSKEEGPDGVMVDKQQLICAQRIYPIAGSYEKNDQGTTVYTYHFRIHKNGKVSDFRMSGADMHDTVGLVKKLGDFGIMVQHPKHFPLIGSYMRGYAEAAEPQLPMVESSPTMGWTANNEFVVGDRFYRTNGQEIKAQRHDKTAALAESLRVSGNFDRWKLAADIMLREGSEKYLYCLAQGFAAPLARFTEAKGFIVHMVGKTGAGKSTVQRLVNSIWGNPVGLMIQQSGSKVGATVNSTMSHMVRMNHLPVCIEEITNYVAEDASDFVYVTGGGRDRMRLTSKAVLKEALTWHTCLVTSGNTSLREKIASTKYDMRAESMRFFELYFEKGEHRVDLADSAKLLAIEHNYGHAGSAFASYLACNHDIAYARVQTRVAEVTTRLSMVQEERLWAANIACVEVGLELAGAIGLIDYTPEVRERLRAYIVTMIAEHRTAIAGTLATGSSLLGDLLNSLVPNTLVVQSARAPTTDPSHENYDRSAVDNYALMEPRGELSVRVELSTSNAFISHAAIKNFCRQRRVSFSAILEEIEKGGYFVSTPSSDPRKCRVELGRGIPKYAGSPAVMCIRIRSNKTIAELGGVDVLQVAMQRPGGSGDGA